MYKRIQNLPYHSTESCFLWGPRQTGKTTLLDQLFPDAPRYDLLLSREFERLNSHPEFLRDELLTTPPANRPVIIDEVQKVPALLDEIQWLMVNRKTRFILCGSSARKLKRDGGNLLGGRALRHELFPLVFKEIPDFDLIRALNHGLLPRHYTSQHPKPLIHAYVGDYLKEEIAAEAITRNVPAFGRFLEAAAFSNGEIVNYKNAAGDCGVSAPTVKEYFQILEDTLFGRFLPSFRKRPKRRVIQAPKFYFFDVGVANFLLKRGEIARRSEAFGKAFEHFIFQEISAHSHYGGLNYPIFYWRTASQFEVDFILGEGEVAVEVKSAEAVHGKHLAGIRAFRDEYSPKRSIVVSLEPRPRTVENGLEILPWRTFLEKLWAGEIIR
ncbi:MAG: ATP-binding protein [Elusimicrobia bacterium]|nr:ATP-binding protein [Elusimicrobiota bacterium]